MNKNHNTLVNHPAVNSYIKRWINENPEYNITYTSRGFRASERDVNGYNHTVLNVSFYKDNDPKISGLLADTFVISKEEIKSLLTLLANSKFDELLPPFKNRHHLPDLPDFVKEVLENNPDFVTFIPSEKNIQGVEARKGSGPEKDVRTYWLFGDENTGSAYWTATEPEKLPIYGSDSVADAAFVFVFEGIKAAKAAKRIATDKSHKWHSFFAGASTAFCSFAGWTAVDRSDWSKLNRQDSYIYIFADNDVNGRTAAAKAAKYLTKTNVLRVEVDREDGFFDGWDIADQLPDTAKGIEEYVISNGYWCTERNGNGNKFTLTKKAAENIKYISSIDRFTFINNPTRLMDAKGLNNTLAHASDYKNIAELVTQEPECKVDDIGYRPGRKEIFRQNGDSIINAWRHGQVKPVERLNDGDEKPWLDFMRHLIPDDKERHVMLRWVATLAARPETRMIFAPLLISNNTGTGKSTLGLICSELVGSANSSFPRQHNIESPFNSWLSCKRLVVVNEIYGDRRGFNNLKDLITEPHIEMNQKHVKETKIENWVHFIFCSNSLSALYLEQKDRRIFAPTVTEKKMKEWMEPEKFFHWLEKENGFGIIYRWALDFGEYIGKGEEAPSSKRKEDIILETMPEAEQRLRDIIEDFPEGVYGVNDVQAVLKKLCEKMLMKPGQIKQIMVDCEWIDPSIHPDTREFSRDWRQVLKGVGTCNKQNVVFHKNILEEIKGNLAEGQAAATVFKKHYVKPVVTVGDDGVNFEKAEKSDEKENVLPFPKGAMK